SHRDMTVLSNAVYYSADDGLNGRELWKTDVAGSTVQVKDIAPGSVSLGGIQVPRSSSPTGLTVFNNTLYFSADDGMSGIELWKSDGTEFGTVQVKDINLSGDSSPSGFTVFNNDLYFSADGVAGAELWKSDVAGTVRVGAVSLVSGLTVFNNALYFSASDGVAGVELWKTDVAGNTVRVKDVNNTTLGAPNALTVL